jgi:maltooligosyltrehalose synthase
MLRHYQPEFAPDSVEWLSIDESERIQLVETYHAAVGTDLPNERVHAAIHVIVENQIAENVEAVIEAMERLTRKDALSRHDALHAIGAVVAEHLFEAMKVGASKPASDVYDRYLAAIRRITAKRWRQLYGD